MSKGKRNFFIFISVLLVCVVVNGCITVIPGQSVKIGCSHAANQQSVQTTAKSGPTRPHPPVRTGEISTGPQVDAGSQPVDPSGGGIVISKSGDPIDGLSIGIPTGAYTDSRTFKVSYAPITRHTFGSDFIAVSPLITVVNGGTYADDFIYVTVPVKIPDGFIAMGFLYDDKTKQLEGMPLITRDAVSITVATSHFSSFFIGMIERVKLKEDADSGFRPGIDDWQFVNNGSYIAPGGHCEGQSIAAMWYYCTSPDGKNACLYGRYDNNGNNPETPELQEDDSYGYRFCSVVHKNVAVNRANNATLKRIYDNWAALAGRAWLKINNKWGWHTVTTLISDATTRDLFAFAIQMTGEPQLIKIHDDTSGGGHTMICYRVNKDTLYIADPNYPGNLERKIVLKNNTFEPYNSGANRAAIEAGQGANYPHIMYFAKSTVVGWDLINPLWTELKNGTIGNTIFPAYTLKYQGDTNTVLELVDNAVVSSQLILVGPQSALGANMGTWVYSNGQKLTANAQGKVTLKPGKNKYGFYTVGKVNNQWQYVDFKYLTLTCGSLLIDPSELEGETTKDYTFTASTTATVGKARFEWSVDGTAEKSKTNTLDFTSSKEGTFKIVCKLYDDATPDKKLVGEGNATATIKKGQSSSTPAFVKDTKYLSFVLNPKANCVHDNYKDDLSKKNYDTLESQRLVFYENNIPVTWSGVNFSGKYKGKPAGMRYIGSTSKDDYTVDCTLKGSVSSDGKTITQMSLTAIYTRNDGSYVETWKYEFTDIPFTKNTDTLKHEDAGIRTLHRQYEVYSSNNPAAHGKFIATYKGPPEEYRSISGQLKQSTGTGTCINGKWEYYSIKDLGPIRFALKINNVIMNGL